MIIFILTLQPLVRLRARHSRGMHLPVIPCPLGGTIASAASVLAVVASPSCPACRAQAPTIEALSVEFPSTITINIIEHQDIARAFGTMALPTSVVIQRGAIAEGRIGLQRKEKLRGLLSSPPQE